MGLVPDYLSLFQTLCELHIALFQVLLLDMCKTLYVWLIVLVTLLCAVRWITITNTCTICTSVLYCIIVYTISHAVHIIGLINTCMVALLTVACWLHGAHCLYGRQFHLAAWILL